LGDLFGETLKASLTDAEKEKQMKESEKAKS
jgi:hypothetical protein